MDIKKYNLDGGSTVEVHQVFGSEFYFAIAEIKDVYPEKGKVAKDIKRNEYLYILDGEMVVSLNDEKKELKKGDNLLIRDGDSYQIEGKGKVLVFVKDEEGAATEVILNDK